MIQTYPQHIVEVVSGFVGFNNVYYLVGLELTQERYVKVQQLLIGNHLRLQDQLDVLKLQLGIVLYTVDELLLAVLKESLDVLSGLLLVDVDELLHSVQDYSIEIFH